MKVSDMSYNKEMKVSDMSYSKEMKVSDMSYSKEMKVCGVHPQFKVFCVMFCRSLFVLFLVMSVPRFVDSLVSSNFYFI
jgi:hypothetical protein